MSFPKIEFKIDKEAEKETALFFLSKKDLFDKFIKDYPELAKAKDLSQEETEKFLSIKIDEYYKIKKDFLVRKKKEIEKNWDKIKDEFFKEAQKIFDNHPWPSGKYIANISLFGMYRLKPGTKIFSIPSEDYAGNPPAYGHINYTIIHEMLHIMFEDFYKKNFKNKLPLQQYYDLMEIVNCIVLNLPKMKKITGWVSYHYPDHKEKYEILKKVYEEYRIMKEFVEKGVEYMNNG